MRKKGALFFLLLLSIAAVSLRNVRGKDKEFRAPEKLSEWGFFKGNPADLEPADHALLYELNTPLFSDYAYKQRLVLIPDGKTISYSADEAFGFPDGSILVKTFYYPADFRKPAKGRRIIETRVLQKENGVWNFYPYLWNEEQTEAYYDVSGTVKQVSYTDLSGKKRQETYVVPNKNQCKSCHEFNGKSIPIGPAARHLNRTVQHAGAEVSQLQLWKSRFGLEGMPAEAEIPKNAVWNDAASGSVAQRARAYLDINCGHCHRPGGQASTSGLYLYAHESDSTRLGINKPPVAAGRAAESFRFSIEPGYPEKSILIYRMRSLDPGIMMPEVGRRRNDEEALQLMSEWIAGMKK